MIKEFLAVVVVLLFATLAILLHIYSFNEESVIKASQDIVTLAHSVKLSLVQDTIESGAEEYGLKAHNVAYPELPKIDYMDFVYAQ